MVFLCMSNLNNNKINNNNTENPEVALNLLLWMLAFWSNKAAKC